MKTASPSSFEKLTWEDLRDWAGDRVVRRGKSYKSRVEDLARTSDGGLLAWVQGGDRYATRVRCTAAGKLSSTCTCPYGSACKHAVATLLCFLDGLQRQRPPPLATEDDERFEELADCDEPDENETAALSRSNPPADNAVRQHLARLPKTDLVAMLMEGRNVVPELKLKLAGLEKTNEKELAHLVTAIRKEIRRACREPGWRNHWNGEGFTPDYAPVAQRLAALLAAGHADAVIDLGTELLKRGMEQASQSNDEGETGQQLVEALRVIYQALPRSTLSPGRQILWDIDARLLDSCGFLDGVQGPLERLRNGPAEAWGQVADELAARLDAFPKRTGKSGDFFAVFERKSLMQWLLLALERAGRKTEIIPVLERETQQTDCYVDLVQRLVQERHRSEARTWALKGIAATIKEMPGIAAQLEHELRCLAEHENDSALVAAFRAWEFFAGPALESFLHLQAAATRARVWPQIRESALEFLETGRRPDRAKPDGKRTDKPPNDAAVWPLPSTGLPETIGRYGTPAFPDLSTLIAIAIHEKRPDDALRWYRRQRHPGDRLHDRDGEKVAQAIADIHPDEAIAIWQNFVAAETKTANLAGYQNAGAYLRNIKQVAERIGKQAEWQTYLEGLCLQNKRRPRMMEVLNALAGRRTRIVPPSA
jgi:uncharacterized Zn finger protein